jgi:hypothetical protein
MVIRATRNGEQHIALRMYSNNFDRLCRYCWNVRIQCCVIYIPKRSECRRFRWIVYFYFYDDLKALSGARAELKLKDFANLF